MKVSYNILKKFVTPPRELSAKELAETLTMHTVEVEAALDLAERLKGAVVGLVTKVKEHPKADKLKLATVDIGKKSLEVVCGGVNLRQGMKVAFAQVGTQVKWHGEADWAPLEKASIRGVVSQGMACAAEELDIPDETAVQHGIMDLSHLAAKPGTPLSEALELADIILVLDNKSITHRPDLWGHLGLARELAAIWQVPFKEIKPASIQSRPEVTLKVTIDEPELCRRYLGVVVSGIKVAESPAWLKAKLQLLGLRPINNIVDATNYVMLELGQPLHAFDLDKLAGPEIIVRPAKPGEKIVTLDGEERKLELNMLVIADTKQAQAIAGVIGGAASEVSENTKSIILESATFDPISIRQTVSALGLRTEASARFEKGLDPGLAEIAMWRVIELILEICPSVKVVSEVAEAYPRPLEAVSLTLNLSWLYRRLGAVIPETEVVGILECLGFAVRRQGKELDIKVPAWRATRDITRPEDLIEEIARLYGYDKIPLSLPKFEITPPPRDEAQELRWKIRELLAGAGWNEILSYSFTSQASWKALPLEAQDIVNIEPSRLVELVNPIDERQKFMRPSLLPNLAAQCLNNALLLSQQEIRLFELGRVFTAAAGEWKVKSTNSGTFLPQQPWHIGLGLRLPGAAEVDLFLALKGTVELIARQLNIELLFKPCGNQSANLLASGQEVGSLTIARFMKSSLKPIIGLAELDLSGFTLKAEEVNLSSLKFIRDSRDLSVIMPRGVLWAELEEFMRAVSPLIESIEVFDIYQEKGSIACRLIFLLPDSAAAGKVDEIMTKIINLLKNKFNVTIR